MKKKQFLAGAALLSVTSALCLRVMKRVGEKLLCDQQKKEANMQKK